MLAPMEAVRLLLALRHRGRAEDLPAVLQRAAPLLDAEAAGVLLVDYAQLSLWPLRGSAPGTIGELPVEGTAAGLAFTTARAMWLPHDQDDDGGRPWQPPEQNTGRLEQIQELEDGGRLERAQEPADSGRLQQVEELADRGRLERIPERDDGGGRLWLPLLHGAERLGVLEMRLKAHPSESDRHDLEVIAALVAELIASRRFYGDAVEHTRRRLPMQLAAEIIWNQLPPLTCAVDGTVLTAVLEPCYDVGGDAFDYAANGDVLHVGLFDTVGHGISASALTTLTLNTYRNARRSGLSLVDTYRSIDKWIRAQYPGSFVTAMLAELDTATGEYRRISAGHPAELVLRDGQLMPALRSPTALPLGLGNMLRRLPGVAELSLNPGDTIVLYTDGITEARDVNGTLFGPERLAAFMLDAVRRGTPPPEIMRRLIHNVISYENGELRDDATAAMLQWHH